jgi:hypothetical protein
MVVCIEISCYDFVPRLEGEALAWSHANRSDFVSVVYGFELSRTPLVLGYYIGPISAYQGEEAGAKWGKISFWALALPGFWASKGSLTIDRFHINLRLKVINHQRNGGIAG